MSKPSFLKPCAHCGGEAVLQHFPLSNTYEARCSECGINTGLCVTREKAIEKWNRRSRKKAGK